jgi:hypothetical protein
MMMHIIKRMVLLLVGLAIIYGMSLADYKVTDKTDDRFKVIWKEYSIENEKEFVIKDKLNFFDGLNNSVAILGKTIIDFPMDGWNYYNNSKDIIKSLNLPIWAETILDILLLIICYIVAALVMIISIPFLLYKLAFFQAEASYHLGICVAILGLILFSRYTENKNNKEKAKPQPQQAKAQ